jgi:hypothetical protein
VGKKYVALIEFFDPEPSDDPKRDVEAMLKYGWKHQNHSISVAGSISVEDYEEQE